MLISYSCKNSQSSPFLQSPRSQCLHTTLRSPLTWRNGHAFALAQQPWMKNVQTAEPDSEKDNNNNVKARYNKSKVQKQYVWCRPLMFFPWISITGSSIIINMQKKYKWEESYLILPEKSIYLIQTTPLFSLCYLYETCGFSLCVHFCTWLLRLIKALQSLPHANKTCWYIICVVDVSMSPVIYFVLETFSCPPPKQSLYRFQCHDASILQY